MQAQRAPSAIPAAFNFRWWWRQLLCLLLAGWAAGCASLPSNVQREPSRAFDAPQSTALGQLVQARRAQARAKPESAFTLLDSVDAALSSRLALVDGAQRTLDLQYYAVHADRSTELLLERIRAAARRGVRVRVLLDDFNTVGDDAQVLRLAFEKGVEMRLFNPLTGSRASLITRLLGSVHEADRIQKRMHNKLFIADNAWGIAGGRNLGDAYFGGDEKSAFVDLDVLAGGAIVRQMSASFDRYWNDELSYPVQSLLSERDLDKLSQPARREPDAPADAAAAKPAHGQVLPGVNPRPTPSMDLQRVTLTWAPATLLADEPGKIGPGDDEADAGETVVDGLLQLIRGARQEVMIISPYFVPGAEMMKVFRELRGRGIPVRVLTNSLASNDAPAAHAGYKRYRKDLLAVGVELHEMRSDPATAGLHGSGGSSGGSGFGLGSAAGGSKSGASRASLHSKAVIIDRRLSVIGSMNLDLRSQRKNSEVALLIRSRALSDASARLIEREFSQAAYQVVLNDGQLLWKAPPGAPFKDATSEPDAPLKLRLFVDLLGPFAPEEML
ncbi:phospholipase D family protein [Ramlibacter humi]|uniref:Phospholipase D family protein n=1 Tax=Ramlibacter humi TaxID=2530451 RepID=A0A4Z0BIK4_9BURK|nr:phospholipase D family protein [Ramlibacter humi]TFY98273.1 phospholipase D family protein [Ramlibacter humi]